MDSNSGNNIIEICTLFVFRKSYSHEDNYCFDHLCSCFPLCQSNPQGLGAGQLSKMGNLGKMPAMPGTDYSSKVSDVKQASETQFAAMSNIDKTYVPSMDSIKSADPSKAVEMASNYGKLPSF
ncbi:hypothetical protein CEXT_83211 [Caerostris extrusa]|uniref:Uncharacterized protein n=1 Tax=Caerostris extrusa TaxID=172846 RepID=A0AAV4S5V5_CAEEX|nr:hypothetical protein CEXT_83211 [Caerostris extrusa]